MEVPKYDELLNPTLRALHTCGGSASIRELDAQVIEDLQAPLEVVQQAHGRGSQTELKYRLAWARTCLRIFGLIANSERGVWALTPEGSKVNEVDPREVLAWVRTQHLSGPATQENGTSKAVDGAVGDASDETASWREILSETLLSMSPAAFERLCQRLLRGSGFIEVEVTGRPSDGGIDGHGIIRIAGMISFTVLFQCKRYRDNIGPGIVRDFRGAMIGRADKGLLITTSGFTKEATLEATRDGAPPIDLIDGELLVDKLRELKLGVATRTVEVVEVDTEWFNGI